VCVIIVVDKVSLNKPRAEEESPVNAVIQNVFSHIIMAICFSVLRQTWGVAEWKQDTETMRVGYGEV